MKVLLTGAGGSTESQKEFLEALSGEDARKTQDRQSSKQIPVANNFALGYTYHDVLDADHEGTFIKFSSGHFTKFLQIPSPASPYISLRILHSPSRLYYNLSLLPKLYPTHSS
jgi:hypothetical protein